MTTAERYIKTIAMALDAHSTHRYSKIYHILKDHQAPIRVTDLSVKMRLEQSIVSQALKLLYDAHLVTMTKQGKGHYYALNQEGLKRARDIYVRATKSANTQN